MKVTVKHKDGTQWIVDGTFNGFDEASDAVAILQSKNPDIKYVQTVAVGFNPFN
jgi:hypothetical protein